MESINKEKFINNMYLFDVRGDKYAFTPDKIQIFKLDEETFTFFETILNCPHDNVTSNYISQKFPYNEEEKIQQDLLVLNGVIKSSNEKKPNWVNISSLNLTLTNKCNLSCKYCFQKDQGLKNKSLGFDIIKKALNMFVKDQPFFSIRFYGGESLLQWEDIKETVKFCKTNFTETNFKYMIFSNGTLLSPEKIDFLKENSFDITITINGHFDLRKKTYENKELKEFLNFEEKIISLSKSICPENLMSYTVITDDNMDLQLLLPYLSSLGIKRSAFSPVTGLREEKQKDLIDRWIKHRNDFLINPENSDYLSFFEDINDVKKNISLQKEKSYFCNAGFRNINIDNNGNFSLCPRFQDEKKFSLGSVEKGLNYNFLNNILTYCFSSDPSSPCKNCFARRLCNGGCKVRNFYSSENINSPDKKYCNLIRSTIDLSLKSYIIESGSKLN